MPGPRSGGVRQSAQSMLDDLRRAGFRVHVFAQEMENENESSAKAEMTCGPRLKSGLYRWMGYAALAVGATDCEGLQFEEQVERAGVNVVVFPTPIACPPPRKVPFVVIIPDLMHRYYPALPEYKWPRSWARDIVYGRYARDAAAVIVDAVSGAFDVEKFLGVPKSKCHVVPFRPPPSIYEHQSLTEQEARRITAHLDLPAKFIFYPAQLWAHKNHVLLIQALARLRHDRDLVVPLVCAGFVDGPFAKQAGRVMAEVARFNLGAQIQFTGYVSTAEMAALYRLARALVFPSLLGPTNIPPLEAMLMGTPVLCSNLFGMPEQVGEAGLLFDPFDPSDIARTIASIWTDNQRCRVLAARGYERMAELEKHCHVQNVSEVLHRVLAVHMNRDRI